MDRPRTGDFSSELSRSVAVVGQGARLRAVASLVPSGSSVADIGAGDGRLSGLLLDLARARRCIATERTLELLERVARHAWRYGSRVDLRAGDGLTVLRTDETVDVIVLSGIGARTMLRILAPDSLGAIRPRRVVAQPQTEPARLRRGMARQGFRVVDEKLAVEGGRSYVAVAFEPESGAPPVSTGALQQAVLDEAGPILVGSGHPLVRRLWLAELNRLEGILDGGGGGEGRERAGARAALCRRVLAALDAAGPPGRVPRRG